MYFPEQKTTHSLLSFAAFFAMLSVLAVILLSKAVYFLHTEESYFWFLYSAVLSVFLLSRLPLSYFYYDVHKPEAIKQYPSVSFVIPVKNEERAIYKTIEHCMLSEYPAPFECIVVNDGSTDGTQREIERAKNDFGERVKVISFSNNKGKREAMAAGARTTSHDVVIFVDSDSFVRPNAARHIVEHFIEHPRIGAVSGNTTAENAGVNALTRMQATAYSISFDVFKASESAFGAVTCCPGCFSAYRKEALLPILDKRMNHKFLWSKGTFGDDRSLTHFVLRSWKVVYCRTAQATTVVPETYRAFFKQQIRWKKSWIREGVVASMFMWKKHPVASIFFYMSFILPILGPLIVVRLFYKTIMLENPLFLLIFLAGMMLMAATFGLYMKFLKRGVYAHYMPVFSLFYMFVLVWQMPWAILRITDTRWGTR